MVFNLIEAGVFGRAEDDRIEDFENGFSFEEAFVEPFRPSLQRPAGLTQRQRKVAQKTS